MIKLDKSVIYITLFERLMTKHHPTHFEIICILKINALKINNKIYKLKKNVDC